MMTRKPIRTTLVGLAVSLFVFSACGVAPEDPWDPSEDGEEFLRVASFNTYNLFDTECDSGDCGPNDFEKTPSPDEYEERITQVAEAIEELDAQIVLLQEIENEEVLDDLAEELDGEYPVAVLGELGWPGSLDVGLLSTGKLEETRGYRDERELERPDGGSDRFTREFLRVDIEIGGRSIIAFTSHFRSKRNDDPGRRLAEAREAREIVDEVAHANPDSLVVFGGDLNDRPHSETLEALTADDGLRRAGRSFDEDELYTFYFDQERQAIDHLLKAPNTAGHYVERSVKAHHDRDPVGYGGSDHGAIVARFSWE